MFRPIYEPRTKAREYCDLAVNIYTGCTHGCAYCYAPHVLRKTKEEFEKAEARKNIVKATENQILDANAFGDELYNKKIMLCFVCDPYPAGIDTKATREIIRAIKDSGNHVQILTKGGNRAMRDFDLLDAGDSFGVTIACNENQREELEPKAAPIYERIETLRLAKKNGIKTWVSCEPVYDTHTVKDLIAHCDFIDLYRIGKLNYHPSDIDWKEFGLTCECLLNEYGREYYIKEDLRACMGG